MSQTTIADKLYTIRFKCDTVSHLTIKEQEVCLSCKAKNCNYFCPADVYEWDPQQKINMVAFENCIECGTCRIACPTNNIKWVYPTGGYGMSYKMG